MDWLEEHLPKARDSFDIFEKQVYEQGELDRAVKELIAVAVATVMRSEASVEKHVERAREAGASDEEIAGALGVAWLTTGSTQLYWMEEKYEELLDHAWYKRHLADASKAFGQFHTAIFDEGPLEEDVAELVGIGVSVVSRCTHCTEAHVTQAQGKGASKQEAAEAIGVAWHVAAETQVTWNPEIDDLFAD